MTSGDFMRYRYTWILVCVSRPMWAEHQEELHVLKGVGAVLQHKVGLAVGSYNVVLRAIVATTQKTAGLDEMLFQRSLDDTLVSSSAGSSGSTGPASHNIALALEAWLAGENLYAEQA